MSAPMTPRPPRDVTHTFESLHANYNLNPTTHRRDLLVDLILEECRRRDAPIRVLDVGCGRGIGRDAAFQQIIRAAASEYWGIEPDESITPSDIFDSFQHAMMETAELPENHFDVLYSSMVMEHVADPEAFLRAAWRCLRPSGSYMFLTPNARHYFARTSGLLRILRLDEFILKIITGGYSDEYHYPTFYRLNTDRRIRELATKIGFTVDHIVYTESDEVRPYLRGPLRPVHWALEKKRKLHRNPRNLLNLFARLTKSPTAESDVIA